MKVRHVLPVFGKVQFVDGIGPIRARGPGAAQGGEPGVENRVADDGVAVLVVLVPAPAPVGDDDGGPVLPDEIAHRQARLIAEGNLPVRISEERGLGSEHSGCLLGGCALPVALSGDDLRRRLTGAALLLLATRLLLGGAQALVGQCEQPLARTVERLLREEAEPLLQ